MHSDDLDELFTKLLCRNARCFTQLPQSWMLRLILRVSQQKPSFPGTRINALDFEEENSLCGVYCAERRAPLKVRIGIRPPAGDGDFAEWLVIS